MQKLPTDHDENLRVIALKKYAILYSERDVRFDRVAKIAAQICQTSMAAVTFVDEDQTWLKAKVGLRANQLPRNETFCTKTILANEVLVVNNALYDDRFKNLKIVVNEPNLRFYAGAPLITSDGHRIGVVCVFSTEPKELLAAQTVALKSLAKQVINILDMKSYYKKLCTNGYDQMDLLLAIESLQEELIYNSFYSTFYNMTQDIQHEINNPLAIVLGRAELLKLTLHKKTHNEIIRT